MCSKNRHHRTLENLARHIHFLLLRHGVITLPEIGYFKVTYTPSVIDFKKGLLIPPRQEITFFPGKCLDNGILLKSFLRKYRKTDSNGLIKYQKQIIGLKEALKNLTGSLRFGSLGSFYQEKNGNLSFISDKNPLLCTLPCYNIDKEKISVVTK